MCPAHRLHHCQQITEAESSQSAELRELVADLRTAKLGFEHTLASLQTSVARLSTEKDTVREKIMMTTLIQKQKLDKQQVCNNNSNDNNDNVYGAVIIAQSHCKSSPSSCDEYGMAPSGRQPSDQANRPGL